MNLRALNLWKSVQPFSITLTEPNWPGFFIFFITLRIWTEKLYSAFNIVYQKTYLEKYQSNRIEIIEQKIDYIKRDSLPAIRNSLKSVNAVYSRSLLKHKVRIGQFQNKIELATREGVNLILEKYHLKRDVIVIFRVNFLVEF